ncbi:beta-ketoacyl synthase N-terminal-like domain-containing protein [Leucobacter sp. M11]|uniref:beta-ketoacyl synthase N-terminal-like domain-containing protein n=1 Tax=Leucobacter sp. M11 TaxID=2993565 RepID=UPI002D7E5756|nr:beta-ketoacyl synthase N-terminal-like domain-containing protein [Leucobacter sp. M11]MEB4613752.1 beta-ketoacyl synthase N-terminal-like domain-containing protein [Leucobacter sp. M11]
MTTRPTAWISAAGVASPSGSSLGRLWRSALEGRISISESESFAPDSYASSLAGQVSDFDAAEVPGRLKPTTDRSTQLALIAAKRALEALPDRYADGDPYLRSIVTANSAGGYAFGERELRNMYLHGPKYVSTAQSYAWFYAVNTGQLSIRYGFKGRCSTVVADSAGGLDAIAQGTELIQQGQQLVLAGSVESALSPLAWVSLESTGRLTSSKAPEASYLPFDKRASGIVPAEGGALLALTPEPIGDGASSIGVLGHARTMTVNEPQEASLERTIRKALDAASLEPVDIDVVFADAAGVFEDDIAEANALAAVFGARKVPVTAPKAGFGRTASGMGPLDTVLAALALRTKIIPPTPAVSISDELPIRIETAPVRVPTMRHALVIARGLPIFTSALVIGIR